MSILEQFVYASEHKHIFPFYLTSKSCFGIVIFQIKESLDTVKAVEKLVAFHVQEHNSRLPHSAFRGQTPDEMYFQTGDSIPEELEAARQKARQARAEANRQRDCEACELPAASRN